ASALRPISLPTGPEAHNHSKGQRPTTPEAEARVSATFSPLNQRILEASPQDRVPECDPVRPAASSPRREGLPPAAKVGALYQADSLIVKGSGGSEARIRISEIGKSFLYSDFRYPVCLPLIKPSRALLQLRRPPARSGRNPYAAAPQG